MSNEPGIPPTARCLRCGYLLRGLPIPVCPECGRAFDPADASTYDLRPPDWRRRWWIKRGGILAVAGVVLLAFFPRALLKSNLTFRCAVCGETTTVYRWEPKPPRWIPFRYPGLHWTSRTPVTPTGNAPPCRIHYDGVSVRFDLYNGGWASAKSMSGQWDVLTLNGLVTTVETAPEVLKQLMDPSNNGIRVGRPLVEVLQHLMEPLYSGVMVGRLLVP